MSWTDRLAELNELLVGLGVAAAILAFVAWFITVTGSSYRRGKGTRIRQPSAGPSSENDTMQDQRRGENLGLPSVAALYIAAEAAQPMERVDRVVAVAGRGLVGDRYFLERGYWYGWLRSYDHCARRYRRDRTTIQCAGSKWATPAQHRNPQPAGRDFGRQAVSHRLGQLWI
jgi:hypothetical protein